MFRSHFAYSLAAVAAIMMVAPPHLLLAEEPAAKQLAADIMLDGNGTLHGSVVDPQGKPLDGANIVISQGQQEVKRTASNKTGQFQVAGLRNGVYTLDVAGTSQRVRLWTAAVAPPQARTATTVVIGEPAMRGQIGFLDPIDTSLLLLGVAGVTVSAISLGEIDDLKKSSQNQATQNTLLQGKLDAQANQLNLIQQKLDALQSN